MKRSEIKSIVKECLLEILMEGVASGVTKQNVNESHKQERPQVRRTALDHILPGGQVDQRQRVQKQSNREVESAKRIAPDDPIMASIFADTATTTLREQAGAEGGKNVAVDTGIDPMSIFENSGNWAKLAFSDSPAKRN